MTDVQSFSFHEYGERPESSKRPSPRLGPTVQSPKLRGWRIDQSNVPKLKVLLRRRSRPVETFFWLPDYTSAPAGNLSRKSNREATTVRKEFARHLKTFKADTQFVSSIHEIVLNPSYLRIIGMGPAVVPFIIEEVAKRPAHWFPALYAICGVDPVPKEDQGRIDKMAKHWVNWAKRAGHLKAI